MYLAQLLFVIGCEENQSFVDVIAGRNHVHSFDDLWKMMDSAVDIVYRMMVSFGKMGCHRMDR